MIGLECTIGGNIGSGSYSLESDLLAACMHMQSIGKLTLLALQCWDASIRASAYRRYKEIRKPQLEALFELHRREIQEKLCMGRVFVSRSAGCWFIHSHSASLYGEYRFKNAGTIAEMEFLNCLGVSDELFWSSSDFEFLLLPHTAFPTSFIERNCINVIPPKNALPWRLQ